MSHSPGRNIVLFSRFKIAWPGIDKHNYKSFSDEDLLVFKNDRAEILIFIEKTLSAKKQPRVDYNELLKLEKIILGETEGARFRAPGASNQNR